MTEQELARLWKLYTRGFLTEEEFAEKAGMSIQQYADSHKG
jgi:hypothetical protein